MVRKTKIILFSLTIWFLLLVINKVSSADNCYWNSPCPYQLFSTKTPYEAVRGDIRDLADPPNCHPISLWSIGRHGNRSPGGSVVSSIKFIAGLKDEIIESYESGRSQLCAQDIENLRKWSWNDTLKSTASHLSGIGYAELFNIGKRIREKFPQLMNGSNEDYYFRPTVKERTVMSAVAFIHGFTDGTNLKLEHDNVRDIDNVIQSYENCDQYHEGLRRNITFLEVVREFRGTEEYIAIQQAVQKRLGIKTQLSARNIWHLYEICRFERSWSVTFKSPWCSAFTTEDLKILEYRDDLKRYYKNGYGSSINARLGEFPMKDLYETFAAVTQGNSRKITSYFTHASMVEMILCTLGLYKDPFPLYSSRRPENRLWKTSIIEPMSNNIIAILYDCRESGSKSYKFQLLHNEKLTGICPASACTWDQFLEKFLPFTNATLDFCNL